MADLKTKAMTVGAALLIFGLAIGMAWLALAPALESQRQERETVQTSLLRSKELLAGAKDYEAAWEKKKVLFQANAGSEEVLNQWVRELLSYAQSQGLVFDKIEPEGIKDEAGQKEVILSLEFKGDIRKLVDFLYHLLENDPLSRVEMFSLMQEGPAKALGYQITLGRIFK